MELYDPAQLGKKTKVLRTISIPFSADEIFAYAKKKYGNIKEENMHEFRKEK